MFINQVDQNGNFKVTDINSDNINATNGTFTNLNTTTFSPTNFNATTAVTTNLTATNGDIETLTNTTITSSGLATSGSINTGTITASGQINTSAGIIASGTISGSTLNSTGNGIITGNLVVPHVIIPSNNNLSSNAELIKLQDELRINAGANGDIGFYGGSTKNMTLQSNGEVLVNGKFTAGEVETQMLHVNDVARIYNSTGKYSSLEKISADLNIYASKNNPTAPSDIHFYSANGLVNDKKMTIHGTTDVVEVETLQANVAVKTDELLLKDTTSVNTSRIFREQNTIKFLGDSLYSSCDYEFYTSDPAVRDPIPKLKINRTNNDVEVIKLRAPEGVITTFNTSITNVLAGGSLRFYNQPGKMFQLDHVGGDVNFYGCKNNATTPSNFSFFTANGNVNDLKLKINAFTDVVEVKELSATTSVDTVNINVTDTVDATTLIADQVTVTDADFTNTTTDDITVNQELDFGANDSKIWSGNASFHFQSGAVLNGKDFKFQTGNVPAEVVYFRSGQGKGYIETDDVEIKNQLHIKDATNTHELLEYYSSNTSQFLKRAVTFENYDMLEMIIFNNNSIPANRRVDVACDMNVAGDVVVNGTNIITEIATKQDTLIAGTGITIVGNTISSTGGGEVYTGAGNISITNNVINTHPFVSFTNVTVNNELDFGSTNYGKIWSSSTSFLFESGDTGIKGKDFKFETGLPNEVVYLKTGHGRGYIQTDDLEVKNISYLKDSTNVHDLMEYWNNAQSQFFKRSAFYDDYDMFDMLTFNNDATPANRSISVDCDMNVAGDLVVNGTNIETQLSSKQDTLSAGAGITIDANNEISYSGATPVTYTAGANMIINAQDEIETVIDPDFDQVDAGVTAIGGGGTAAVFHHKNLTNGFSEWAITHYSNGKLILNSKSSQEMLFRQNQITKARISTAGDFEILRQGTLSSVSTEFDGIQSDLVGKQTLLTAGANIALDSFGNISSTDTTYTAGTGIAIDAGNVISSSVGSNQLSRISYYELNTMNTVTSNTVNYYINGFTTVHNNLNLNYVTQTNTDTTGWLLPEGSYKIEYKCCIDQGTYINRLGGVVNFSFDGVFHLPSRAFGYSRDANNIDQQSLSCDFLYDVPAGGQRMRIRHNCGQNINTYASVWPATASLGGMALIVTRLDTLDVVPSIDVVKYGFHVSTTADGYTTYPATYTKITFNTSAFTGGYEIGTAYDYTNHNYTVPKAGIWRIHLQCFVSSNVGSVSSTAIYSNDTLLGRAGNRGASVDSLTMNVSLSLNDVIDCRASDIGLELGPTDTFWSMEWISNADGTM